MHPLAVGNLILMPTARDVLAVDLETGKRLWPIRGSSDNSLEQLLTSSNGVAAHRRADQSLAHRTLLVGCHPRHAGQRRPAGLSDQGSW